MASMVLYDAFLSVGGTDLSDHVKSITIDAGTSLQDDTAMGDTFQSNANGLATWSITVEFLQDYAASKVDATLYPLLGPAATNAALIVRPASGSVATSNPSWTGTGVLESYNPVAGSVGDQAMATATWQSASALVRATS
tara:strand:+ start:3986 stop:4402 length:417 start_codon:yes stop_codon:yes gene_type:complete